MELPYNLITGNGFGNGFSTDSFLIWIGGVVLFFLASILRKQTEDGFLEGTNFNFLASLVLALPAWFLTGSFTGDARWSFLAGIIGLTIGGFVIGLFGGGE